MRRRGGLQPQTCSVERVCGLGKRRRGRFELPRGLHPERFWRPARCGTTMPFAPRRIGAGTDQLARIHSGTCHPVKPWGLEKGRARG